MVDLEGGGQPEAVDAAAGRPVHMDTTAVQLQVLPARRSDLRRWQSEEFERPDPRAANRSRAGLGRS